MAVIYKTNGERVGIDPANGKNFSLEEMQKAVGGYVQILRMDLDGIPRILICNEEGKLEGLPVNDTVTALVRSAGGFDEIVGDVLICLPEQLR